MKSSAKRERPKTVEEAAGRLWGYAKTPAAGNSSAPAGASSSSQRPLPPISGARGLGSRPTENPQIGELGTDACNNLRLPLAIRRKDAQRLIDAWDLYSLVLEPKQWHRAFGPILPDAARYLRRRLKNEAHAPDAMRHVLLKTDELAIEATPVGLQALMIFSSWDSPLLDDVIRRAIPVLSRWEASVEFGRRPDSLPAAAVNPTDEIAADAAEATSDAVAGDES